MTKIDNSYLEKLGEVVYDENQAINYKMVSIKFGVHVNIAKQMLYHFYTTEKRQGKKIFATYYVSGMVPRKTLAVIGTKTNGLRGDQGSTDDASQSQDSYNSPSEELDSFLVLICRDKDLEEYKTKFTKIFSIHVYSLSCFPLENYDVLERLAERPLKDDESRRPVDFGPVVCSASQKLIKNSRAPVKEVADCKKETFFGKKVPVPEKVVKEKGEDSSKEAPNETKSEKPVDKLVKSNNKSSQPTKTDSNRLKNMFANSVSKPKPAVETAKPKVYVSRTTESSSKTSDTLPSTKVSNGDSRKRKRIRDVLSSESEGEKDSDVEEESLPESPIPRKRLQIDSDSDEDFKETPSKVQGQVRSAEINSNSNGAPRRRRVAKTISKSFIDKEGFLVTTKEQIMVSEDEGSDSDKATLSSASGNKNLGTQVKKPAKEQVQEKPVRNVSSKGGSGKTKQASLMSFFQKK